LGADLLGRIGSFAAAFGWRILPGISDLLTRAR